MAIRYSDSAMATQLQPIARVHRKTGQARIELKALSMVLAKRLRSVVALHPRQGPWRCTLCRRTCMSIAPQSWMPCGGDLGGLPGFATRDQGPRSDVIRASSDAPADCKLSQQGAADDPLHLIFSNISAVPPRIATRSASDRPGVASTSSTMVLVQGYG